MSHVTVEVAKGHPKLLHDVTKVYSAPCIESMVYLRLNVLVCQLLHCSVSYCAFSIFRIEVMSCRYKPL